MWKEKEVAVKAQSRAVKSLKLGRQDSICLWQVARMGYENIFRTICSDLGQSGSTVRKILTFDLHISHVRHEGEKDSCLTLGTADISASCQLRHTQPIN